MKRCYRKIDNQTVPVVINGTPAFVKLGNINEGSWTKHHGETAAGVQVNSLETFQIGQSMLIRTGRGRPAFSTPKDEFEVLSRQFLEAQGYTVKAPQSR